MTLCAAFQHIATIDPDADAVRTGRLSPQSISEAFVSSRTFDRAAVRPAPPERE